MSIMEEVIEYYNSYDEDGRLERDNFHRVEFLTTVSLMDKYIKPGSRIFDVSAGTGRYSFYLAGKGYEVVSGDIVQKHVDMIREKNALNPLLKDISVMDARDLSRFQPESFDAVLCMGPLYHLGSRQERVNVIKECLRVLKSDGLIFAAYVNRHAVFINEMNKVDKVPHGYMDDILNKGYQDVKKAEVFCFSVPQEIEEIMTELKVDKVCNAAADGIGHMMTGRINGYSREDFDYWMNYHIRYCTDPHLLGYSLHGLFIGRK